MRLILAGIGLAAFSLSACAPLDTREAAGVLVIDEVVYHLGDDLTPEWGEAAAKPDGERLDLTFVPREVAGEQLLVLEQRHVDDAWYVEVNGSRVATLRRGAERSEEVYVLPAGTLVEGRNTLAFVPEKPSDDITLGNVRIVPRPLREELKLRPVRVEVRDAADGSGLPARVTVTDSAGALAELYYAESLHAAVRPGVVYTSHGVATFELPEGEYDVYATRGAEWGLGQASLVVGGRGGAVELVLRREVDTSGFIACDTHIHTLTFSGHGDASMEERVVTLAGEGVELAIATDHNHNTDYRSHQARASLNEAFTSIVGNEVTTDIGHFNGFPLDPTDEVPDHTLENPVALVAEIRAHGAEVVILNHPRWPDHDEGPFGAIGLNRFSGDRGQSIPMTFDATELVNSDTAEEDPMFLFVDWFALLNRGERIAAVGSSDSHTVASPVGQGRTYVVSSTDVPARIDTEEACANIKAGRSSISLGMFCQVELEGGERPGDLAQLARGRIAGTLRIAAPAWVAPRSATVFVDGVATWRRDLEPLAGAPFDRRLRFDMPWSYPHDAWVVCVILGDGVTGPYWPSVNAYTLAATNPIWVDADGDGRYASPRETALALLPTGDGELDQGAVEAALTECDDAVAVQVLSLARGDWIRGVEERVRGAAGKRAEAGIVWEYLKSVTGGR